MYRSIPSASASTATPWPFGRGGTRTPARSSRWASISGTAPTAVATTGRPQARDSISAVGWLSAYEEQARVGRGHDRMRAGLLSQEDDVLVGGMPPSERDAVLAVADEPELRPLASSGAIRPGIDRRGGEDRFFPALLLDGPRADAEHEVAGRSRRALRVRPIDEGPREPVEDPAKRPWAGEPGIPQDLQVRLGAVDHPGDRPQDPARLWNKRGIHERVAEQELVAAAELDEPVEVGDVVKSQSETIAPPHLGQYGSDPELLQ